MSTLREEPQSPKKVTSTEDNEPSTPRTPSPRTPCASPPSSPPFVLSSPLPTPPRSVDSDVELPDVVIPSTSPKRTTDPDKAATRIPRLALGITKNTTTAGPVGVHKPAGTGATRVTGHIGTGARGTATTRVTGKVTGAKGTGARGTRAARGGKAPSGPSRGGPAGPSWLTANKDKENAPGVRYYRDGVFFTHEHQRQYRANWAPPVAGGIFTCNTCDFHTSKVSEIQAHWEGMGHIQKIAFEKLTSKCFFCDSRTADAHNWKNHILGRRHRNRIEASQGVV